MTEQYSSGNILYCWEDEGRSGACEGLCLCGGLDRGTQGILGLSVDDGGAVYAGAVECCSGPGTVLWYGGASEGKSAEASEMAERPATKTLNLMTDSEGVSVERRGKRWKLRRERTFCASPEKH